jgi:hypothetical protein
MLEDLDSTDTATEDIIYTLRLTKKEADTVGWVGGRYCWSDALLSYIDCAESEQGAQLTLEDMTYLKEQFIEDTEGGHDFFPCLLPGSSLYSKLCELYRSTEETE